LEFCSFDDPAQSLPASILTLDPIDEDHAIIF
jgi:hypothetical protein